MLYCVLDTSSYLIFTYKSFCRLQKFNITNHQNLSQLTLKDIEKKGLQAQVTVLADMISHTFDVSCFRLLKNTL